MLENCFLRSFPKLIIQEKILEHQEQRKLLHDRHHSQSALERILLSFNNHLINPDSCASFFSTLQAALAPKGRNTLDCYNQGLYEQSIASVLRKKDRGESYGLKIYRQILATRIYKQSILMKNRL